MYVREIAQALDLHVIAGERGLGRQVTGGYAADLLSCTMARAQAGNIWTTVQAHPNVVAVATLLELACVIITEGVQVEAEVVAKADEEGLALLTTAHTTFWVIGELTKLGIKAQE